MIFDFETLQHNDILSPDICVVGAGVAGLSLAKEFLGSGLKVLILEGGGKKDELRSQKLYRSEVIGVEHDGIHNGRFRVFGGSSTRWGGQLMTYRLQDFERKPYIDFSGWPINRHELDSYYQRADAIMRVNNKSYENDLWDSLDIKPIPFDSNNFQYRFSKWANFRNRNLAKYVGPMCETDENINILLHANAVEIRLDKEQKYVESIRIKSYRDKESLVKAQTFIICAGTIETARLLLASRVTSKNGVGNNHDLVGRFFQDHISYRIAHLNPFDKEGFIRTFNPFYRAATTHTCKIDLAADKQDELGCTHVMGHVVFEYSEESGFYEFRRVLRAMQSKKNPLPTPLGAWRMLRFGHDLLRMSLGAMVLGRRIVPKSARSYLQLEAEQAPSPQSRITLSDETDELGMPRVKLDWRLSVNEKTALRHFTTLFRQEWERLKLGKADWALSTALFEDNDHWLEHCRDTYHQTGTTRMSDDPRDGVVDPNLRVHSIENLYIGSCSVFPTGGTANPTLTMIALCMRLADRLKSMLNSSHKPAEM